jgi:hypothetical protein
MNKTDDILEKLKNMQQPEINNPIELTDLIMGSLDSAPSLQGRARGGFVILPIVRAVLSLAAMWIVGFFIYLQYEATVPSKANNTSPFGGGRVEACTLKEVYKSRFCQDCQKTISYTQIRSMLYENK